MYTHYNHGCGYEGCEQCAPGIEREKERMHFAARRYPTIDLVSEWQAEERADADEVEKTRKASAAKVSRISRAKVYRQAELAARVKRVLTTDQRADVDRILAVTPCRKTVDRNEWLTEVWIELLGPTVKVGFKETRKPIETKLMSAIMRAEIGMRRSKKKAGKDRDGN